MHVYSIPLNSNFIKTSAEQEPSNLFHCRQVRKSTNGTTKSLSMTKNCEIPASSSTLHSRSARNPIETNTSCRTNPINQITITDSGTTLSSEKAWQEVEYYLEKLM